MKTTTKDFNFNGIDCQGFMQDFIKINDFYNPDSDKQRIVDFYRNLYDLCDGVKIYGKKNNIYMFKKLLKEEVFLLKTYWACQKVLTEEGKIQGIIFRESSNDSFAIHTENSYIYAELKSETYKFSAKDFGTLWVNLDPNVPAENSFSTLADNLTIYCKKSFWFSSLVKALKDENFHSDVDKFITKANAITVLFDSENKVTLKPNGNLLLQIIKVK